MVLERRSKIDKYSLYILKLNVDHIHVKHNLLRFVYPPKLLLQKLIELKKSSEDLQINKSKRIISIMRIVRVILDPKQLYIKKIFVISQFFYVL